MRLVFVYVKPTSCHSWDCFPASCHMWAFLVSRLVPLFFGSDLRKSQRVQIGLVHDKTQANRLAGEICHIRFALPLDETGDGVALKGLAILERKAGNGFTVGVLNLDTNFAGSGSGIIQFRNFTGKLQRFGEKFSRLIVGMNGDETVVAQQIMAATIHEHTHVCRTGRHHIEHPIPDE